MFSSCNFLTSLSITNSYAYEYEEDYDFDDRCQLTEEGLCAVAEVSRHKTVICGCANSTIPDDAEVIADYAFAGAALASKSIDLSNCIEIGDHAFEGTALGHVTIGSKIKDIGDHTFSSCSFEEYDEYNPSIIMYYSGSFESLENDDQYKEYVLYPLTRSCGYAYARIYEYNGEEGDSEVKRINEWYGGGSGSGSGY